MDPVYRYQYGPYRHKGVGHIVVTDGGCLAKLVTVGACAHTQYIRAFCDTSFCVNLGCVQFFQSGDGST